jgi:hypothetical protein
MHVLPGVRHSSRIKRLAAALSEDVASPLRVPLKEHNKAVLGKRCAA